MTLATPYYLIDEAKLLKNLKAIGYLRKSSGAKFVLALKCFSGWSVFKLMKKYLDGTTSSSLYEARLGCEKFKKEVHAYSVAFSEDEVKRIVKYADKIIFNSISQLKRFYPLIKRAGKADKLDIGLRVNPGLSFSQFDLADCSRKHSRLGVRNKNNLLSARRLINGLMFHFNCENDNFTNLAHNINKISKNYANLLKTLDWVSLGGGIHFTKPGYPIEKLSRLLKNFASKFEVQVYLEPGEAIITQTAELVTKVLDIVSNQIDIAIVDSSTEAHMLDLLVYRTEAKIKNSGQGRFKYMVAGRSCLAGDIFGTYRFKSRLKVGKIIRIADAAGYTMVKKNWFNGLKMPSIAVKRLNGSIDLVRSFEYNDYLKSLS